MLPLKLKFPSTWALPLTSNVAAGVVVPMPMPPLDCEIAELPIVPLFFHTAM